MATAALELDELLNRFPAFLTDVQVEQLGLASRQTLANWRSTRRAGPPFVKCGGNVRYPKSGIIAYLRKSLVTAG